MTIHKEIGAAVSLERMAEDCCKLARVSLELARIRREKNGETWKEIPLIYGLKESMASILNWMTIVKENEQIEDIKLAEMMEEGMRRLEMEYKECEETMD